jgi:hypothetical protein
VRVAKEFPATSPDLAQDQDVWFHETWATGDKSYSAHGIRWGTTNFSPQDKAPVVTSVNPPPGRTHSLQFEFSGNPNPADDAFAEQRFVIGNRPRELYICWDMYVPGPADRDKGTAPFFQRNPKGPGNNKLLRIWDDVYEKRNVMAGLSFQPSPRSGVAHLTVEYIWVTRSGRLEQKTNFGPWTSIFHEGHRGKWNRFGFHARLASGPDTYDGLIEVSLNGKVLGRYDRLPFGSHANPAKNYFGNGYLLGWSNSGYSETTRFWIGDVVIAPRRPEGC